MTDIDNSWYYPYGIYVIIKKYAELNYDLLERVKSLIKAHMKLTPGGLNIVSHTPEFDNVYDPIKREIVKIYGNIFKGYEWGEKDSKDYYSNDYIEGVRYLIWQYYVVAVAELFLKKKKLSPIEAAFESAFRMKFVPDIHISSHSLWWNKRYIEKMKRSEFLKHVLWRNCIRIYLAVKYFEQLGYEKNPVKDEKLCEIIGKNLEIVTKDLEKRQLTKEEWLKREDELIKRLKSRRRVQY